MSVKMQICVICGAELGVYERPSFVEVCGDPQCGRKLKKLSVITIPTAELEELVAALEMATSDLDYLGAGIDTAAKFRAKYLEGGK